MNNEALYDQRYKWPSPHPVKITPQTSTISLFIIYYQHNLLPNSYRNAIYTPISSLHLFLSISATPITSIDTKMPCWSCHLCNEWNQPHFESCIECCHRRCRSCKVHYAMSSRTHKAFRSRIPVRSAGSFKSGKPVRFFPRRYSDANADHSSRAVTPSPVPSNPPNMEAYLTNQLRNVFLSVPDSSNLAAFHANQKLDSRFEKKSDMLKRKAEKAWEWVVKERRAHTPTDLVREPEKP